VINEVVVGPRQHESLVRLEQCVVSKVFGVADPEHLPSHIFFDTEVLEFDTVDTNNAVLQRGYPPQLAALILALRRLYDQAGRGRKRSAFYRGITDEAVEGCVDEVLDLLKAEGMITVTKSTVHPVRGQYQRAREIIQNPLVSDDSLVAACT
jgi:hypothetical protein